MNAGSRLAPTIPLPPAENFGIIVRVPAAAAKRFPKKNGISISEPGG